MGVTAELRVGGLRWANAASQSRQRSSLSLVRDPISEEDRAAEDICDFCIKCTQAQHTQKERQTQVTNLQNDSVYDGTYDDICAHTVISSQASLPDLKVFPRQKTDLRASYTAKLPGLKPLFPHLLARLIHS